MKVNFVHDLPNKIDILCVTAFEGQESASCDRLDAATKSHVMAALKTSGFTGKKGEIVSLLAPPSLNVEQLLIVGLGEKDKLKPYDPLYIGAGICAYLNKTNSQTLSIALKGLEVDSADRFAAQVVAGFLGRSYHFLKYHTYEKNKHTLKVQELHIATDYPQMAEELYHKEKAVIEGTFYTRDLLCEPPNILYPDSMAKRLKDLEALGVKVETLDEKEMATLGMGALLGVGQGSSHPPRLVVLRWEGADKSTKPMAFVGKGITFDTGGISIKPSSKMDEMKYDMGGAAVICGLIKSLALQKAAVNVVGVLALAENMPDGGAQRPGDIVKTMSGQTIEVLDTDAEGRLILADALFYAQDRFKPQFMIDLATLTGAMVVALGEEYAGIFANDDKLADQLSKCGYETNEKVWRLPLDEAYDRLMDSEIADIKNISARGGAGSIKAAQFLQRFVNKTSWVHIDIAGVAWGSSGSHPLSGKYPSGYGVRLLNTFLMQNYKSK